MFVVGDDDDERLYSYASWCTYIIFHQREEQPFTMPGFSASLGVEEMGRSATERECTDTSHHTFSGTVMIIMNTLHTSHTLSFHLDWILTPVVPPGASQ